MKWILHSELYVEFTVVNSQKFWSGMTPTGLQESGPQRDQIGVQATLALTLWEEFHIWQLSQSPWDIGTVAQGQWHWNESCKERVRWVISSREHTAPKYYWNGTKLSWVENSWTESKDTLGKWKKRYQGSWQLRKLDKFYRQIYNLSLTKTY